MVGYDDVKWRNERFPLFLWCKGRKKDHSSKLGMPQQLDLDQLHSSCGVSRNLKVTPYHLMGLLCLVHVIREKQTEGQN